MEWFCLSLGHDSLPLPKILCIGLTEQGGREHRKDGMGGFLDVSFLAPVCIPLAGFQSLKGGLMWRCVYKFVNY